MADWDRAAEEAVRWCADSLGEFTSDDVWARLDEVGFAWPANINRKNLATVLLLLAGQDVIERTNRTHRSERRERHGGSVAVWVAAGMAWAQIDAVPTYRHLRRLLEAAAEAEGMELIDFHAKLIAGALDRIAQQA